MLCGPFQSSVMDLKLSDPNLQNDPRFLDSIFNISSIDTNILLAGGLIIIAFILFGESHTTRGKQQNDLIKLNLVKQTWSGWWVDTNH